jgi:hypothetical protein
MSWPGIEMGRKFDDNKTLRDFQVSLMMKIENHFGNNLNADWCIINLNVRVLSLINFDKIKKYGRCEYCKNYVGIKSEHRKLYKIVVLNSYCSQRNTKVKHNDRCCWWEPAKFYKQILQKHIDEKVDEYKKITKDIPFWMEPLFNKVYDDDGSMGY